MFLELDAWTIRQVYPVTKGLAYGNGNYEFLREAKHKSNAYRAKRSNIVGMSKKSLIRLMFVMQCTSVELGTMLTLTYPKIFPKSGQTVKKDINVIAQKIRRLGWSYVWFLEFQERGAPHVHFLLSPDVVTPYMRADFGLFWTTRIATSDWWQRGCKEDDYVKEVLKMARVNCHDLTFLPMDKKDGAKRYATKYAAKEKQKQVPAMFESVGRFWGMSRDVSPEGIPFDVTEEEVEEWLVDHRHPATAYDLVPRYIWGLGKMKAKGKGDKPDNPMNSTDVVRGVDRQKGLE